MCLLLLDEIQRGGGTCVMVTRGVDGLAKLGGMGPHVAALVRHSENEIKVGLRGHSQPFVEHGRRFFIMLFVLSIRNPLAKKRRGQVFT